jgi:putative flippase GtrA
MNNTFTKYLLMGLINTIFSYIVFIFLYKFFNANPIFANLVSFLLGLLLSFILMGKIVFNQSLSFKKSTKFILGFVLCYCFNIAVFTYSIKTGIKPEFSQVFGQISYSILFYFYNKKITFI